MPSRAAALPENVTETFIREWLITSIITEYRQPSGRWYLKAVRVGDVDQVQPDGRCIDPARGTVTDGQQLPDPFRRLLAAPDGDQYTGDAAYHVVQEGIRNDIDMDAVTCTRDIQPVNRPHRTLRLAGRRPKGGEILLAKQVPGRKLHAFDMQRQTLPADPVTQQGRG